MGFLDYNSINGYFSRKNISSEKMQEYYIGKRASEYFRDFLKK